MGAAGSVQTGGKDSYISEETKALPGDTFDQAIFDVNKDATGQVTQQDQASLLAQVPVRHYPAAAGVTAAMMNLAGVATVDQAFVEQTGIAARISAALQKALFRSPRPTSPEAFAKAFSEEFANAELEMQGDRANVPQEMPGGGEYKNDAEGDDVVSVHVEMLVRTTRSRVPHTSTPLPCSPPCKLT